MPLSKQFVISHSAHLNMALRDNEQWKSFFTAAGIPGATGDTYATKFVENRITENSLADLTKDYLHDLEIKVVGDILAILRHAKSHAPPTTTLSTSSSHASVTSKAVLSKAPHASSDMTNPQFRKFRIDWDVFKKIACIPHDQVTIQLYNLCDEGVQNGIINTHWDF